jgi:hypothetical protein
MARPQYDTPLFLNNLQGFVIETQPKEWTHENETQSWRNFTT